MLSTSLEVRLRLSERGRRVPVLCATIYIQYEYTERLHNRLTPLNVEYNCMYTHETLLQLTTITETYFASSLHFLLH